MQNKCYYSILYYIVVWENFTIGVFRVKNFMLRYFHLLGYKYVHLLPIYVTGFAKTDRIITTSLMFNIVTTLSHCPDTPTIRL